MTTDQNILNIPHDYLFRTVIVGNAKSGKSTFCKTYANGYSSIETQPTIGVDFISKKHELDDGSIIKVNLWDTAGQEAFRSIIQSYYRDLSGAIILFDLTKFLKLFRYGHELYQLLLNLLHYLLMILL